MPNLWLPPGGVTAKLTLQPTPPSECRTVLWKPTHTPDGAERPSPGPAESLDVALKPGLPPTAEVHLDVQSRGSELLGHTHHPFLLSHKGIKTTSCPRWPEHLMCPSRVRSPKNTTSSASTPSTPTSSGEPACTWEELWELCSHPPENRRVFPPGPHPEQQTGPSARRPPCPSADVVWVEQG